MAACSPTAEGASGTTVRLGYFPNITHATAIVGLERGLFADALGDGVRLELHTFNAGGDAIEAIFSGALDASYIGPNPALNAFAESNGQAIRIISGATSGGAALVVRQEITSPEQLAGARLASPQLGNTQDVALRAWLAEQGYETTLEGGGDVEILPQANGDILTAFGAVELAGAWVPEPWATRMVEEAGGHVLVDEAELWPDGDFVTTHLIVATQFLEDHPDVVKDLLVGQVEANGFVNAEPEESQRMVRQAIAELTGSELDADVVAAAWDKLTFTNDPIASSLAESAADAQALGLLEERSFDGIYDLTLLNEVLVAAGEDLVPQP
ncbi:MAG TPA: ABC transporter substrate-binding protein [Candidatus Limnocylindria bacterium]|nr:ABC transporter substrate-binding protein [Candidatus Limnocylindria bacterium]